MIRRPPSVLLALCFVAASAFGQTAYSESSPYEPEGRAKGEIKTENIIRTEAVLVPISVFDKTGKPVTGITGAEVTVFVDGTAVQHVSFAPQPKPTNVVVVLDTSPSSYKRAQLMREQARNLVESLPAGVKVMIVEFNSELHVRAQLTDNRAEALEGLRKIKVGDGTSLYSAVRTLHQKIIPPIGGPTIMVLVTDGVDTTSTTSTYANSLQAIERMAVPIYPIFHDTFSDISNNVGFTGPMRRGGIALPPGILPPLRGRAGGSEAEYKAGRGYLDAAASASGGRVISSEKFDDELSSFISEIKSRYEAVVRMPQLSTETRRGIHIRINRPGLTIRARGSVIDR